MGRERITCFLIDDDIDDQDIFSIAMKDVDASIECVFANDGVKALDRLQGEEAFLPHFIFVDMNMPKMNGLQCLEGIKKISRLGKVPVFMYSTSADPKAVSETKALGAVDFIVKPSSILELSTILRGLFISQTKTL